MVIFYSNFINSLTVVIKKSHTNSALVESERFPLRRKKLENGKWTIIDCWNLKKNDVLDIHMNNLKIVIVKEKMLETCRRPLRANNDNYIKEQFLNSVFFLWKKIKGFQTYIWIVSRRDKGHNVSSLKNDALETKLLH